VQRGVFRRDSVEINRPTFLAGGARAQLLNRKKSTTYCRCCAGVARDRGKWAGEGASGAARGRVPGEETWLCHCCATIAIKSSWNLDFSYSKEHLSQRGQPNQLFSALWRPRTTSPCPPTVPQDPPRTKSGIAPPSHDAYGGPNAVGPVARRFPRSPRQGEQEFHWIQQDPAVSQQGSVQPMPYS